MGRKRINVVRRCTICNSDKTYVSKKGYEDWGIDKVTGLIICKHCIQKQYRGTHKEEISRKRVEYYKTGKEKPKRREYLIKNRELIREKKKMRVFYKPLHKAVALKINPKSGQCQRCGVTDKRTSMHHAKGYNDSDILDGTIELCNSCHTKEHCGLPLSGIACRRCGSLNNVRTKRHLNEYRCNACKTVFRYPYKYKLPRPRYKII